MTASWESVTVTVAGAVLPRGRYPWRRALTLWRTGRGNATVTHEGATITPADVAWNDWQDQPPRASGPPGVARTRTAKVLVRFSGEELEKIQREKKVGESNAAYLRRCAGM